MAKKSKLAKFWDSFKLKASLLRIWFFKNLKTLIINALIIYGILVFTGNANGDFIFGELSKAIDEAKSQSLTSDVLVNIAAAGLSICSSVLLFLKRTEGIKLSDIKSKKLKLAMVSAGLYFNKNGKLTKRVEKALKVDIDEDGKVHNTPVEEVEPEQPVNIITETVGAFNELATILTTKIETQEDYEKVMTPELEEMKKTIEETEEKVTEEDKEIINELIKDEISVSGAEEENKEVKVGIFTKIFIAVKDFFAEFIQNLFSTKNIDEVITEEKVTEEETESIKEIMEEEVVIVEEKTEAPVIEVIISEEVPKNEVQLVIPKEEKKEVSTQSRKMTAEERAEIERKKRREMYMARFDALYGNTKR